MKPLDHAELLRLITDRSAFHTAQGAHGAALYEALAADPQLPENLPPPVCAQLLNVEPSALAQRRKRGDPPSFLRLAQNAVAYPRSSFFLWLRARFVERQTPAARQEYTKAA